MKKPEKFPDYESPQTSLFYWDKEMTVLCTSDEMEPYEQIQFEFDD